MLISVFELSGKYDFYEIAESVECFNEITLSGKSGLLPAQTPLRTVHDSFPSHGSSIPESSNLSDELANYLTSRYGSTVF